MSDGITLVKTGVDPLVGVLTLGVYRSQPAADSGRHVRSLSEVGRLVHYGKYIAADRLSLTQEDALARLSELLCAQIANHALFRGFDLIVGAPSSSGKGFSDRLTEYVADRSGLEFALANDAMPGGRSRKLAPAPRQYTVAQNLSERSVIALDDVYGEGVTMSALAVAIMSAGADRVAGLAPVRLLRG